MHFVALVTAVLLLYYIAHRLMAHVAATAPEKADSLMEELFHAYFEQVNAVPSRIVVQCSAVSAE